MWWRSRVVLEEDGEQRLRVGERVKYFFLFFFFYGSALFV